MGVRKYLDQAIGVLTSARRRGERHLYSKELLYNIEVVIRACSMIKDQAQKENYVKQIKAGEAKLKAYKEKIKAWKKADADARAKRPKKKIKSKPRTQKRTRKIAA